MTNKCPIDSSHFTKQVFLSSRISYDYCTVCKEDLKFLQDIKSKRSKKGELFFLNNHSNKFNINLFDSRFDSWNYLIAGQSDSGKTSLVQSILNSQRRKAKIFILDQNGDYDNLVKENKGLIIDAKDLVYQQINNFDKLVSGYDVVSINFSFTSDNSSCERFLSLLNYLILSFNRDQKKIFICDHEFSLMDERCSDLVNSLILSSADENLCNVIVTRKPLQESLLSCIESFNYLIFCGDRKEVCDELVNQYKLNNSVAYKMKHCGLSRNMASGEIRYLEFLLFNTIDKDNMFIHKFKS